MPPMSLLPARLRARLSRATPPREELVGRLAAGRSFADVGCMWSVHGAIAFAAEAAGATEVSGMDIMGETPEYRAEHARRGSRMRFVQGDLHDEVALAGLGEHDVVWCSGVLYHAPHPLLTLERLASVTRDTLILATETLPERLGTKNVCVFAPEPGIHPTHTEPFDPARGYVNWYWAITPSALRAMLGATGFTVVEEHRTPFHATMVARRLVGLVDQPSPACYREPMKTVGIHEAKTTLSSLVREVEDGEEILVTRGGRPVAKLVPVVKVDDGLTPGARGWGMFKGQMHIADDFKADSDEMGDLFGIGPLADAE